MMSKKDGVKPIRSLLFCPGDREDEVRKAYDAGADAIMIDLEEPRTPYTEEQRETTRKAMDDVFAAIPDVGEPPAATPAAPAAPIAPVDGATVENVFERAVRESFEPVLRSYLADNSAAVIERMKPVIREWMDEHFPALLEGAVRAEVERVVKSRGTKR